MYSGGFMNREFDIDEKRDGVTLSAKSIKILDGAFGRSINTLDGAFVKSIKTLNSALNKLGMDIKDYINSPKALVEDLFAAYDSYSKLVGRCYDYSRIVYAAIEVIYSLDLVEFTPEQKDLLYLMRIEMLARTAVPRDKPAETECLMWDWSASSDAAGPVVSPEEIDTADECFDEFMSEFQTKNG